MGAHLHLPLLGIVIGHSAPAAAARCFAANRRAVNCLYYTERKVFCFVLGLFIRYKRFPPVGSSMRPR